MTNTITMFANWPWTFFPFHTLICSALKVTRQQEIKLSSVLICHIESVLANYCIGTRLWYHYETRHFFPFQSLSFSFYDWVGVSSSGSCVFCYVNHFWSSYSILVSVCCWVKWWQRLPWDWEKQSLPSEANSHIFLLEAQNVFFLPKLFSPFTHFPGTSMMSVLGIHLWVCSEASVCQELEW